MYLDFGFLTALCHCLPVKAVHVTHDSIYLLRTIYAKAGTGTGCAPWAHRRIWAEGRGNIHTDLQYPGRIT